MWYCGVCEVAGGRAVWLSLSELQDAGARAGGGAGLHRHPPPPPAPSSLAQVQSPRCRSSHGSCLEAEHCTVWVVSLQVLRVAGRDAEWDKLILENLIPHPTASQHLLSPGQQDRHPGPQFPQL